MSPYLVMEFIDGQTLSGTTLPRRALLEVFAKVARAVDAAHRAGIVHRDLKPLNIMITSDRWPFVMDFGLARNVDGESSLSQSGDLMGTPAYMPPEQAEGRLSDIDARSDIYSLGATMYSTLLGRPPFPGQTTFEIIRRVVKEPVTPPRSIQPDFPPEVQAILMKSMAKEPNLRYASAAEMAEELGLYLDGGSRAPAPLPPEPPVMFEAPPPPPRPSGGKKAAMVVVALLVAVGIGVSHDASRPLPPKDPGRPAHPDTPIVKVDPPTPQPQPPVPQPRPRSPRIRRTKASSR
jgi:serine/threonine protein kinase